MCVCVYGVLIVYTIRLNMWCVPQNRQKSDQSSPGIPSYTSGVTMVSYWHWCHRPYYSCFTDVFWHPNYFSKVVQDCAMETKHASGVPAPLFKVGIHLATQFLLTFPYIFSQLSFYGVWFAEGDNILSRECALQLPRYNLRLITLLIAPKHNEIKQIL